MLVKRVEELGIAQKARVSKIQEQFCSETKYADRYRKQPQHLISSSSPAWPKQQIVVEQGREVDGVRAGERFRRGVQEAGRNGNELDDKR